mgnify:CR=1 FL=1
MLKDKLEEFKNLSKDIIIEFCKEHNLPIPNIVFAPCPDRPSTSCIINNVYDCKYENGEYKGCKHDSTTVYINPYQYGLRTLLHEMGHYEQAVQGNATKSQDEELAESRAREIIAKYFPHDNPQGSTIADTITTTTTLVEEEKDKHKHEHKPLIIQANDSCLSCALKHLLSAKINLEEASSTSDEERQREKMLNVLGHIHEAENHLATERPELAQVVRDVRKQYEFVRRRPNPEFLKKIEELAKIIDRELEKEVRAEGRGEVGGEKEGKEAEEKEGLAIMLDPTSRDCICTAVSHGELLGELTVAVNKADWDKAIDILNRLRASRSSLKAFCGIGIDEEEIDAITRAITTKNKMAIHRELGRLKASLCGQKQLTLERFDTHNKAININSDSMHNHNMMKVEAYQLFARPVSDNFRGLYTMLGIDRLTGLDADTLNEANTPEIIGWFIDTVQDTMTTPFGHVLNNVLLGAGLYLVQGLFADQIAPSDRRFLANLGSHFFWRVITLLNPAISAVVKAQAATFGARLANRDFVGAVEQVFITNPFTSIRSMIDNILQNISGSVGEEGGGEGGTTIVQPIPAEQSVTTVSPAVAEQNILSVPEEGNIPPAINRPQTPNVIDVLI